MADERGMAEELVEEGIAQANEYAEGLRRLLMRISESGKDLDQGWLQVVVSGIMDLNSRFSYLPRTLEVLATAGDRVHALQVASQAGLVSMGFGDDPSKLAIGGLYLDTDDPAVIDEVEQAYHRLLGDVGIKVVEMGPVVTGSWYRRWLCSWATRRHSTRPSPP